MDPYWSLRLHTLVDLCAFAWSSFWWMLLPPKSAWEIIVTYLVSHLWHLDSHIQDGSLPLLFSQNILFLLFILLPLYLGLVAKSCPTLCDPMDCSLPDSSVHGILQARILDWVAISSSRGSSRSRNRTQVHCIAGRLYLTLQLNMDIFPTQKWSLDL